MFGFTEMDILGAELQKVAIENAKIVSIAEVGNL